MKRLAETYIYGNFHIALIGGFLYYLSRHGWGIPIQKSCFVSILIFIYYNFCNILSVKNYHEVQSNSELKWVSSHLTEILFLITGALAFIAFIYLKNYPLLFSEELYYVIVFGLGYFFIKNIPIIKNIYIGFVWVFVLHLWSPNSWNPYDFILLFYLSIISFFYDRCQSLICKFSLDVSILFPHFFLFYFIQEVLKFLKLE